MKKLISKIKGVNCKIKQEEKEIHCSGENKCKSCCGINDCDCGANLSKDKKWKKQY